MEYIIKGYNSKSDITTIVQINETLCIKLQGFDV